MGNRDTESIEKLMSKLATEAPKRYSFQELQIFTSNFSNDVGSGGFGKVYKGQFNNGVDIAVKVLLEDMFIEETFEAEVSTVGMTSHRYLVKLYGFCFDPKMKALVYEYMKNGSLDKILYGNPLGMDWETFYRIATQTAKGLSYLHDGCHKQIIHYDVKAANILLDPSFHPKITDFGLAKLLNSEDTHRINTGMRGTMNYAAPEVLMPSTPVIYKCDVYSFGMLLFEILGMRNNGVRGNWFPTQVWEKFKNGQLDVFLTNCGIPEKSVENAKTLSMIAFCCAQWIPENRPSMNTVVMMLEKKIEPTATPPYPFYPYSKSSVSPSKSSERPSPKHSVQPMKEVIHSKGSPSIDSKRPSPKHSVQPMQEVVHSKVSPSLDSQRFTEMGKGRGFLRGPLVASDDRPLVHDKDAASSATPPVTKNFLLKTNPETFMDAGKKERNKRNELCILIVFYSMYGHVEELAKKMKEGVDAVDGVKGVLYRVPEILSYDILEKMRAPPKDDSIPIIIPWDLASADGILFGFPTRFGVMAAQMKAFFDSTGVLWRVQELAGKPAGFFVSTGLQGGGQETAAWTAITQLSHHGMLFVPIGYSFGADMFTMDSVRGGSPYGAGNFAADGSRQASKIELALAVHQGSYMATIVKKLAHV